MIKLETTEQAPMASAIFAIESTGKQPAITLHSDQAWKPSEDDWVADATRRKQIISFFNDEGRACELIGPVSEPDVVEISAAHKVVALVTLKLDRKSGQMRLAVQRIVEVWTAPGKRFWAAVDWQSKAVAGPVMGPDGKIAAKVA